MTPYDPDYKPQVIVGPRAQEVQRAIEGTMRAKAAAFDCLAAWFAADNVYFLRYADPVRLLLAKGGHGYDEYQAPTLAEAVAKAMAAEKENER